MTSFLKSVDDKLLQNSIVMGMCEKIEEKTTINKKIIARTIAVCVVFQAVLGIGMHLVGGVFCVCWPLYQCLRALESNNADEIRRWLQYWIVFSLLGCVETLFGFALGMIPFYAWVRTLLVGAMMFLQDAPTAAYAMLVKPIWREQEEKMDFLRRDSDIGFITKVLAGKKNE